MLDPKQQIVCLNPVMLLEMICATLNIQVTSHQNSNFLAEPGIFTYKFLMDHLKQLRKVKEAINMTNKRILQSQCFSAIEFMEQSGICFRLSPSEKQLYNCVSPFYLFPIL